MKFSSLITIDAVLKGIRRYVFLSRSLKRVGLEWKLGKGGGGNIRGMEANEKKRIIEKLWREFNPIVPRN